ncbi:MAG TPA: cupin domain-containing protein [Candidatus Limnocylindrales bacterium]|nr:cupin domain-containing protein [Candidatus Limnocylindrales bacterium]
MSETWRPVTRLERADFYADWLAASQRNAMDVERSPIVARGRDLTWIETPNEYRIAMLIGNHVGFPTNGTNLCTVAIPAGHHTGRHRHGEEAIHILRGSGFVVVAGRRYDIRPGTTIHVPYMDDHQLFNTGASDLEYVSASTIDLDLFVKLGRLEQLDEKGPNEPGVEAAFPAEAGQFDSLDRRIALHLEDAPNEADRQRRKQAAAEVDEPPHADESGSRRHDHDRHQGGGHGSDDAAGPGKRLIKSTHPHRHGAIFNLMGGGESHSELRNGFTATTVAMTQIFEEVPHTSSHCHTHTEAVLYVLEGVGFSEIDDEHYDWEAGDAVQIPPKMTRHEHFNPSDRQTRTLRIEYGIRYFYEQLWPGYFKVEHRETSIERP